jgi:beta-lactamase superfamily II metal-dependent hydrolase
VRDASVDAGPSAPGALSIYFVDSEGGQSTVFHLPSGELLVVDTGNPGPRDGERMLSLIVGQLGASRIDYLLTTHYDGDHWGGVPYLADRIEVGLYLDHGDVAFGGQPAPAAYLALANAGERRVLAAGERLELGGVALDVVAAGGELLPEPLAGGGGLNPFCEGAAVSVPGDPLDENVNSVGFVLRFGAFEILDLADLLWSQEHELSCPLDRIGPIDLYLTTHHGLTRSGAAQLVRVIDPLAAIMNNGPRKGGGDGTWQTLELAPGAADVWQVHRALGASDEQNAPEDQIANLESGAADEAIPLKVSVAPTGEVTIENPRTGFQKTYQARP